jgi:hypothetical protein
MQLMHQFHFAERVVKLTYPANAFSIDVATACEGRPRDYKSFQLLAGVDSTEGLNLYARTYSAIMADKFKYQRSANPVDFDENDFGQSTVPPDEAAYSTFVSRNHRNFVFFTGSNVGLYPTPQSDKFLMIGLHIFLNDLSADGDTNFLLDNCYDFVIYKSLRRLNVMMKTEGRIMGSQAEIDEMWLSVLQWDKEVMIGDQPHI